MKKRQRNRSLSTARRFRLGVEACEPRRLLATFVVTSAADNGDNTNPTPGSLRAEILLSDASPAPMGQTNLIQFNITGPSTIAPVSVLPQVTVPTVIDGRTQPNTPVVLDGVNLTGTSGQDGLQVFGSHSTIEGLTIDRFSGIGINCINGVNIQILNNFIGTDPTGESSVNSSGQSLGNGMIGLYMNETSGDLIEGNVISGNSAYGLAESGTYDQVIGNKIGTDATGTHALPNLSDGINIGGSENTIGGTTAGSGNLISGNGGSGVYVYTAGSVDNVIEGNMIGTDVTGTLPLGNAVGVSIIGGIRTTIGGTAAGAGNIISHNTGDGVFVGGSSNVIANNLMESNGTNGIESDLSTPLAGQTLSLEIEKNLIGTDIYGSSGLGNGNDGILIDNGSTGVLVLNNVVSGSVKGSGIDVQSSDNTDIEGNLIGTDISGILSLGNHADGILLNNAANVRIYGSVIVGCVTGSGIHVKGTSTDPNTVGTSSVSGISIIQDHIGVTLAGTSAIPNFADGINIAGDATSLPTSTPVVIQADVISGNGSVGLRIAGVSGVVLESSLVGTNEAGTIALPNAGGGVKTSGTDGFLVLSNVISGNSFVGLSVTNSANFLITDNEIGVGLNGAIALGNIYQGVSVGYSTGLITQNTISSNLGYGLNLAGAIDPNSSNPAAIAVVNNKIGTDSTGLLARGNNGSGIAVVNLSGVTILGNVIASNTGSGIEGNAAYGTQIFANTIGTGSGAASALPNGVDGIDLEGLSQKVSITGNHIVDNKGDGIGIHGLGTVPQISDTYIADNTIGTLPSPQGGYVSGMGNLGNGIALSTVSYVVMISNVIDSNTLSGITANQADSLSIQYNYLGTDSSHASNLGNGGDGLLLSNTSSSVLYGNAIAANGANGINLINASTLTIKANFIGTDADGLSTPLGNGGEGLSLNNNTITFASNNDIEFNTIANNAGNGVDLMGLLDGITFAQNQVGGALPVVGSSTTIDSGNGQDGVLIFATRRATPSVPLVISGNIIADNGTEGLQFAGGPTGSQSIDDGLVNESGCQITGNHQIGILVNANTQGITIANTVVSSNLSDGIVFDQSPNNTLTNVSITNNTGKGLRLIQSPGIVLNNVTESGNGGGD